MTFFVTFLLFGGLIKLFTKARRGSPLSPPPSATVDEGSAISLISYASAMLRAEPLPSLGECRDWLRSSVLERRLGGVKFVGAPLLYAHDSKNDQSRQFTCVCILETSHFAIHTYEHNSVVVLDCVVSGDERAPARALLDSLLEAFSSRFGGLAIEQHTRLAHLPQATSAALPVAR